MTEPSPAPVRRRLDQPDPEELAARRGCMRIGAVLGIVVGIAVAFFVVPPLMGHFFGEANVLRGETYAADAKTLRVTGAERVAGPTGTVYEVKLEITTNKTWAPERDDFTLERVGVKGRLVAQAPDPARPETSLVFTLAQPRTLLLRFVAPAGESAEPDLLFIADPRVRLELRESAK